MIINAVVCFLFVICFELHAGFKLRISIGSQLARFLEMLSEAQMFDIFSYCKQAFYKSDQILRTGNEYARDWRTFICALQKSLKFVFSAHAHQSNIAYNFSY